MSRRGVTQNFSPVQLVTSDLTHSHLLLLLWISMNRGRKRFQHRLEQGQTRTGDREEEKVFISPGWHVSVKATEPLGQSSSECEFAIATICQKSSTAGLEQTHRYSAPSLTSKGQNQQLPRKSSFKLPLLIKPCTARVSCYSKDYFL